MNKIFAAILMAILVGQIIEAIEIEDCPMRELVELIEKADELGKNDSQRTRIIKKVAEKQFGCGWGVVLLEDKSLSGSSVFWNIRTGWRTSAPNEDRPARCTRELANDRLYVVFKTTEGCKQ